MEWRAKESRQADSVVEAGDLAVSVAGSRRMSVNKAMPMNKPSNRGWRKPISKNPLTMAAAKATLLEILTPEAHAHIEHLRDRMTEGAEEILARHRIEGYVSAFGAKGAVIFSEQRINNYRDFMGYDGRYGHVHWLYQHNGGVFLPPWGKCEQWTLSVQHSDDDVDVFLANLDTFASALKGVTPAPDEWGSERLSRRT